MSSFNGIDDRYHGAVKSAPFIFLAGAIAAGLIGIAPRGLRGNETHGVTASPTPTLDRLAQPTLPAHPAQADLGGQVYWLHCQPCHGDEGQGLTDEWRAQYPPEDQNCWKSGCHSQRPYKNGFTLPATVPALIGPTALSRFDTAENLHGFIAARMPFQAPASLAREEYWQVTAYLIRAHGVKTGEQPLDDSSASQIRLRADPRAESDTVASWLWPAGALAAALLGLAILWLRRRTAS
ncbi:MAG: hypothetical protein HY260_09545 [Chloroflexi bacterium]|nr:hypothetical protein [Chloroflexota bacterium]